MFVGQALRKWKILKDSRLPIINELVSLGIHNQVLYPDLDGLAKGLWQIEVVRNREIKES
jgi:hypothetical protein